jgi:hypothetical protein
MHVLSGMSLGKAADAGTMFTSHHAQARIVENARLSSRITSRAHARLAVLAGSAPTSAVAPTALDAHLATFLKMSHSSWMFSHWEWTSLIRSLSSASNTQRSLSISEKNSAVPVHP